MRVLLTIFAAFAIAFGCTSPAPSPTSTPAPSRTASPTPPPSPAPSREPSPEPLHVELIGDQPVLRASALDGDHYSAILPAAYFEFMGTRHAYVVGFGDARGDQRVYHATSIDGVTWLIDPDDPFADLGLDLSPPGPIPASVLQAERRWVMYLWGVPAPQFEGSAVWRATADAPGGPWTADTEPVLLPGDTGTWDDLGLDFPAVVPTADGYFMLYSANGGPQPNTARIGRATSADGVTWLRGSDPVIDLGICPFDAQYMAQPRLVGRLDGYTVFFNTERRIGAATAAADGLDWHCLNDDPLLSGPDIPGGEGIHTLAVAQVAGGISVLAESLADGGSEIWLGKVRGLN